MTLRACMYVCRDAYSTATCRAEQEADSQHPQRPTQREFGTREVSKMRFGAICHAFRSEQVFKRKGTHVTGRHSCRPLRQASVLTVHALSLSLHGRC